MDILLLIVLVLDGLTDGFLLFVEMQCEFVALWGSFCFRVNRGHVWGNIEDYVFISLDGDF